MRRLRQKLLILVLLPAAMHAAEYTFTKIADNAPGSPYSGFDSEAPLVINQNGQVLFNATLKAGPDGVFISSGGTATSIIQSSLTVRNIQGTGLNDSGTVVLVGEIDGVYGIYRGAGGQQPSIVAAASPELILAEQFTYPAINNSGTVAFSARYRIMVQNPGARLAELVSDTELLRQNALSAPSLYGVQINDKGTVSFGASGVATPCGCGIFKKDAAATTGIPKKKAGSTWRRRVESAVQIAELLSLYPPPINSSGTVAFAGLFNGKAGIFAGDGGAIATLADLTGGSLTPPLAGALSLNDSGRVAFASFGGAGGVGLGIYTGRDPVADKVIAVNDQLLGSTVPPSGIVAGPAAGRRLNNRGQIVFLYRLTNGLAGIAVATPVNTETAAPPVIPANGIFNAATFVDGGAVSPGSIVSIFGQNLAPKLAVSSGAPLPASIDGVSVTINGAAAPLYFVSPGQINAQAPFETASATAEVRVRTPFGETQQPVRVAAQSPGVYTVGQNGVGQGVIVFANTSTLVAQAALTPDSRPAAAGDIITIYLNGMGAVSPPVANGSNSCEASICEPDLSNMTLRHAVERPVVTIGGVTVPDDHILFAGLAPQFVGLYQINLRLPTGLPAGDQVHVVIRQGANTSRQGVTIGVR